MKKYEKVYKATQKSTFLTWKIVLILPRVQDIPIEDRWFIIEKHRKPSKLDTIAHPKSSPVRHENHEKNIESIDFNNIL